MLLLFFIIVLVGVLFLTINKIQETTEREVDVEVSKMGGKEEEIKEEILEKLKTYLNDQVSLIEQKIQDAKVYVDGKIFSTSLYTLSREIESNKYTDEHLTLHKDYVDQEIHNWKEKMDFVLNNHSYFRGDDLKYDGKNKRIINVSDPVDGNDVVNLSTLLKKLLKKTNRGIDFENQKLINVADATLDTDCVNLKTLNTKILKRTPNQLDYDFQSRRLTNIGVPSHENDAISKSYFDKPNFFTYVHTLRLHVPIGGKDWTSPQSILKSNKHWHTFSCLPNTARLLKIIVESYQVDKKPGKQTIFKQTITFSGIPTKIEFELNTHVKHKIIDTNYLALNKDSEIKHSGEKITTNGIYFIHFILLIDV